MRCSSCNFENAEGKKFCIQCGVAFGVRCPNCGSENPPGASFCGDCGAVLVVPAKADAEEHAHNTKIDQRAVGGERRHLTVLFCDLVGSTPLSQRLDAEEFHDVIAQYQQAASGVVARFGGYVAKNLGDGLLIYFGWPTAREDDPERAVRAGLGIVEVMAPLNAAFAAADGTRLEVRIGVHTGPVVIADGGEVFGETANIAARVQTAAEPDTVAITAATQRLVAGIFVVEDLGPHPLKGVREPVTLFRAVQESGMRSRLDVAAGRLTRFVGREPELATLIDHWERAQDGEGQNVLIVGEAGVGKSRLASQFREHLATVPHTWLECGATPYTASTPFHPIIELVRQGLALAPEDTGGDKLGKLEAALTQANLASHEATMLMADFLNLERADGGQPLAMSPDLQRRRTMELLAAWELALTQVQPVVLVVEDLHWADPSSLELLGRFIAQSATARVMLIGTARPEFVMPWPERSNLSAIKLARLSRRQARAVIELVATAADGTGPQDGGDESHSPALSDAMIDAIVARADGIPLYLEELTKTILEPGTARRVEEIPATLADSLMARLDRLSAAKEVAQRASVLGREFAYPLLAAMVGLKEAALRHGLARLDEAEILFVRGEPPTATYTFKHALVQEAAYESLLKRSRRELHGRVVDVILAQFPERAAAEPEVVARHAEAAGRIDEAITYLQRAGKQAQTRSAHGEAITQFRKAIALLETQPAGAQRDTREVALQLTLGSSLNAVRGYAHAEVGAAYERARVLCEAVGDARPLGIALLGLATFYQGRGEVERARLLAARLLKAAEQRGDTEMALLAHSTVANPEYFQGKFASALAHCEAVRILYEPKRHHSLASVVTIDPGVDALCTGAWALWTLGWPDRALERVCEAVALAKQLSDLNSLAQVLCYEAAVHWLRQNAKEQDERAGAAITLSEVQGFPLFLGLGKALRASARAANGESGAVADMLTGVTLMAETGSQNGAPALFVMLTEAYGATDQLDAARGTVETGLAVSAQGGQVFFDAELLRLQGEILLATGGAPTDAEALFNRALEIARAQEAKSFELRAATSLARLLRDQDKHADARDLLAPVHAWFTEGFDTGDLKDAKALLDELGA